MTNHLRTIAWLTLLLFPSVAVAQDKPFDAKKAVAEMAEKGAQFDASALHKQGRKGLALVLDELFPNTAEDDGPLPTEKEVQDLLKKLGDKDARVREEAFRKLSRSGRHFRDLIEKATKDKDPDVRLRALMVQRALRTVWAWELAKQEPKFAPGFQVYLDGIKDAPRLELLARRIRLVLDDGSPDEQAFNLLIPALRALSRARDDRYGEILKPLLKHKDVRVPVMVIQAMGSHGGGNTYFPQLLLDAMTNDRKQVVRAALDWGPCPCWDEKKAPELRRRLTRIFKGDDAELKFRASFTLMHDFDDEDAFRYILTQTKSKDGERARTAIYWIGDSCHWKKPITTEILDTLSPFLRSPDDRLRRAASTALATYSGEAVVKALIPMLGDRLPIIVEGTGNLLLDQEDKAMLKRLLRQAAEKHVDPNVRARAKEVLSKVTEK